MPLDIKINDYSQKLVEEMIKKTGLDADQIMSTAIVALHHTLCNDASIEYQPPVVSMNWGSWE